MAACGPPTVTMRIAGPLERADLSGLFERTCALLEGAGAQTLRCEVGGVTADAVALDALARLALAARRRGCAVRLCGGSDELRALIALTGLAVVLPFETHVSRRDGAPRRDPRRGEEI